MAIFRLCGFVLTFFVAFGAIAQDNSEDLVRLGFFPPMDEDIVFRIQSVQEHRFRGNQRRAEWTHELHLRLTGEEPPDMITGSYSTRLPAGDVRAAGHSWVRDFVDGRPRPEVLAKVAALRDLLTTGGRTLSQGALGWLLARSPKTFPIPGFKNEDQVRDNLGALHLGPLPKSVMADIDRVLASRAEQP